MYIVGVTTVDSTIVWGNTAQQAAQIVHGSDLTVRFCDVMGGSQGVGGGGTLTWCSNLETDPLFLDPAGRDLHLAPGSPCEGTGNPDAFGIGEFDLDSEPRVMGGRVDIGVDEITDRAFVFGDMTCDGFRNGADIDPFFLALGRPDIYAIQFPHCVRDNGDANGDGRFNGGDILPFFKLLSGFQCP